MKWVDALREGSIRLCRTTLVTAFMIMGAAILLQIILRTLGYSLPAMVEAIELACQIAKARKNFRLLHLMVLARG